MRKMNESLLRSYIRGILYESRVLTSDVFLPLQGVIDPFKRVLKKISEYEKSNMLEPHEAYKFSLKIRQQFFNNVIKANLRKILGDSPDWEKIIGYISFGMSGMLLASGNHETINIDEINYYLNQLINSGDERAAEKFPESIRKFAEEIRIIIEDEAENIESELADFHAKSESKKENARNSLGPVVKKFDEAVEVAVSSIFEDSEISRLFKDFNRLNRLGDAFRDRILKKIRGLNKLVELLGPTSGLKEWTREILVGVLKNQFNIKLKNLEGEELQKEAKSIVSILKSVPRIVDSIKKEIESDKKKIDDAAEAPKDAPLGQIAFAPSRKKKPFEANTEEEEDLLRKLINHFEGIPLDSKSFNRIREIMKNDWYKSVFQEVKVETVYRGISVNEDWFDSIMKGGISGKGSSGKIDVDAKIGKEMAVSSWATKKSVADEFGIYGSHGSHDYSVVMYAKTEDNPNKFLDCEGLYDVQEIEQYQQENEVICFGPAKIYRIEWKKLELEDYDV